MPNYSYTHGDPSDRNRLRLLIGDHRGTNGTNPAGWLFSDEELDDVLALCPGSLTNAAAFCLTVRMNREAMAAGVSGTTDTSDRPWAIAGCVRNLSRLSLRGEAAGPQVWSRTLREVREDEEAF
ncbi:MAG: hypothetical protein RMJ43_03910 [Chloroherpetonaceae bacterium]|nr:hypothetical protein [Chloroherpetonaceae bacterium]